MLGKIVYISFVPFATLLFKTIDTPRYYEKQKKTPSRCLFLFIGGFACAELVDAFDDKAGEEVGGAGKEDREYEYADDVDERSEDAERIDYGEARLLDKVDVALIEIMEADLERVRKDRRDSYVDREEDRHDL